MEWSACCDRRGSSSFLWAEENLRRAEPIGAGLRYKEGARRSLGQHIASNWCFGQLMVFFTLKNKAYSNLIHAGGVPEDSNLLNVWSAV